MSDMRFFANLTIIFQYSKLFNPLFICFNSIGQNYSPTGA